MNLTIDRDSFAQAVTWVKRDKNRRDPLILTVTPDGRGYLSGVSPLAYLIAPFNIISTDETVPIKIKIDASALGSTATIAASTKHKKPIVLSYTVKDDTLELVFMDGRTKIRVPVYGTSRKTAPEYEVIGQVDGKEFQHTLRHAKSVCDPQDTSKSYHSVVFVEAKNDLVVRTASSYAFMKTIVSYEPVQHQSNPEGGMFRIPERAVSLWNLDGLTDLLYVPVSGGVGFRTEAGNIMLTGAVTGTIPAFDNYIQKFVDETQNSVIFNKQELSATIGIAKSLAPSESSIHFEVTPAGANISSANQSNVLDVAAQNIAIASDSERFAINTVAIASLLSAINTKDVFFAWGGKRCYVQPVNQQSHQPEQETTVCGMLSNQ